MAGRLARLLDDTSTDPSALVTAAAIGAITGVVLPSLANFLSWIRFHFLSRSRLSLFQHVNSDSTTGLNDRPWALVTGASDGIGKGFVQELAAQQFNVILHGRNASKIDAFIAELRAEHPTLVFEAFICNATERGSWSSALETLVSSLTERRIPLTVLVNNVGGNPVLKKSFYALSEYTPDELTAMIDMNATFPAQITRALLPVLKASKPSVVLNMASVMSIDGLGLPYLTPYGSVKSFNRQFSKSLRLEMVAEGCAEVEVVSVVAARVQSGGMNSPESVVTPTSRQFARSVLGKVGGGRSEIVPWWSHSFQIWSMTVLPVWLRETMLVAIGKKEKVEYDATLKKEG